MAQERLGMRLYYEAPVLSVIAGRRNYKALPAHYLGCSYLGGLMALGCELGLPALG